MEHVMVKSNSSQERLRPFEGFVKESKNSYSNFFVEEKLELSLLFLLGVRSFFSAGFWLFFLFNSLKNTESRERERK